MALIKYYFEQVGKEFTTTNTTNQRSPSISSPHPPLSLMIGSELVKYVYDNFIYYFNFIIQPNP